MIVNSRPCNTLPANARCRGKPDAGNAQKPDTPETEPSVKEGLCPETGTSEDGKL